MVQWFTIGLAILGFVYNGYKDYSSGQIKMPLTTQNQTVEYTQPLPIVTWQVAFDPNTRKLYHLHPDGKWYEQVPQVYGQTQYPPAVGTAQGAQQPQIGQRDARLSSQASPNPWLR